MSLREDQIISFFAEQSNLKASKFPIGIGDDMAQVNVGRGESVLITTDMLLDGVHFDLKKVTYEQAAYKAMLVSISDCAAMASLPICAVVSVALPNGFNPERLKEVHRGIVLAGKKYGCELVGGDITIWKDQSGFAINVAMLGECHGNGPVKRSGAKVGDVICVTGFLGGAGLGRHMEFEPRVTEAVKLAQMVKINSMMDISDGLSSDLNRICKASGVGAVLEPDKIPISEDAQKRDEPLSSALNEGEDFELLFTLDKKQYEKLTKKWDDSLQITAIGEIVEGGDVVMKFSADDVRVLEPGGFDHFSQG